MMKRTTIPPSLNARGNANIPAPTNGFTKFMNAWPFPLPLLRAPNSSLSLPALLRDDDDDDGTATACDIDERVINDDLPRRSLKSSTTILTATYTTAQNKNDQIIGASRVWKPKVM